MSLLLHMVARNETGRYLDACLEWSKTYFDRAFLWDDQSTDGTPELAKEHGFYVGVREDSVPTFLEAEGAFREVGWDRMISTLEPEPGDWIMTLDADEFLMGDPEQAMWRAQDHGYSALRVNIPEVFLINPLAVRIDGFWGDIDGFRACQFESGDQSFKKHGMGCGTLPAYARSAWNAGDVTQILHVGYANMADRQEKFQRYTSTLNNGHAGTHVMSIMGTPELVLWDGETPNIWRGIRAATANSVRREL